MIRLRVVVSSLLLVLTSLEASAQSKVVIATGSALNLYSLADKPQAEAIQLLSPMDWASVAWPNWREADRSIVFEGRRANSAEATGIYVATISTEFVVVRTVRLTDGRMPSISPDGNSVAIVDHEDHLKVISMSSTDKAADVRSPVSSAGRPVVWIDQGTVVFTNEARELTKVELSSGVLSAVGIRDVVPVAMIDGQLLCVDYSGRTVLMVDPSSGNERSIKQYRGTRVGIGLAWNAPGRVVLLSRQTWPKLLRFSEGGDLFSLTLDGTERRLVEDLSMSGGFGVK